MYVTKWEKNEIFAEKEMMSDSALLNQVEMQVD